MAIATTEAATVRSVTEAPAEMVQFAAPFVVTGCAVLRALVLDRWKRR